MKSHYRIGARGSALSRAQVTSTTAALQALAPDCTFEFVVIKTSGDQDQRNVLGAFVREVQAQLVDGSVDLAVHSCKDLPTATITGLTLAAMPARQDPRDAILSRHGAVAVLPQGARIGAGSPRRVGQLLGFRPDLSCAPIVGNVDTRVRKLLSGEYDAMVIATAGLKRLGYWDGETAWPEGPLSGLHAEALPLDLMLPAPAQGALAIECRGDDVDTLSLVRQLNVPETQAAVIAERAFLDSLGGGCRTPVGALARIADGVCRLQGCVAALDGSRVLRDTVSGPAVESSELGRRLAETMLAAGADRLIAEVPA